MANMQHGIILPNRHRNIPGRAINVKSKKREENNKIRLDKLLKTATPKICVKRRLGGIGDVLMSTPLLKAIKKLIPRCELTYATDLRYAQGSLADVIQHNPYVDKLISSEGIISTQYDYCVDITSTGLGKERAGTIPPNRIDMFAEAVGVDISDDPVPDYELKDIEKDWAKDIIKKDIPNRAQDTKIVALQTRSNDARRTWPLECVDKLIELLTSNDIHVYILDWGHTSSRWKESDKVHLTAVGTEGIWRAAAIIEQCDAVICPDSSILHLAGALNKKIISIFGPIPPESRINHYANAVAVTKDLPCKNCWYQTKCARESNDGKLACLTTITPEEVFEATMRKIAEPLKVTSEIVLGRSKTNHGQDRVIMIRRSTPGLGDILMATPAIKTIKTIHPDMKIEVACQSNLWPGLQNNPNIDKLVDINDPYNAKRYYAVIDISTPCAKYESARIAAGKEVQKSRVEIYAEACGVLDQLGSVIPEYFITSEENQIAKEFMSKVTDKTKQTLMINVKAAERYRDWPAEELEKLISILSPRFNIILSSYNKDKSYPSAIDVSGQKLREKVAILNQCVGLITVDTSWLHLAAALNKPTVALFGPIDYKVRCKEYKNTTVVKANLPCIPCWRNGKTKCKETNLIQGYSKCLSIISAKQIADIIVNKFSK